jgi:hypothetical protein
MVACQIEVKYNILSRQKREKERKRYELSLDKK